MFSYDFKPSKGKTEEFLENALKVVTRTPDLKKYAERGVQALRDNTPKDTGRTANSWYYDIEQKGDSVTISWKNSNINDGVLIAAIIQYGHGTGTGGYVRGTDYINPAMKPVFQQIADDIWREVTK